MSDALTRVLLNRARIRSRIAQQRDSVVVAVASLERPIALIDGLVGAGRALRAHPVLAVGVVVGVFVLRARTLVGMVGRGIGLWRLFNRVRAVLTLLA